jgi:arylsulfatase
MTRLEELKISEKTFVIFMTDNGPQQRRYNAGMRGLKSSVYRGGVRVPFWIRHPGTNNTGIDIEAMAANIDLFPTLADICNARIPDELKIDGINLAPLLRGEDLNTNDRSLFFYWTRHSPELYTNIALQKGRYKLVGKDDYNASIDKFELFDIVQDPYEQNNILNDNPERAAGLKKELDLIFYELAASENLIDRPRIVTGTTHENPVILNRNDADGQWGIWVQSEIFGFWRVLINEGRYNLRFKFIEPVPSGGKMMVETGAFINQMKNDKSDTDFLEMKDVKFPSIRCDFVPFYLSGTSRIFPLWVEIERIDI